MILKHFLIGIIKIRGCNNEKNNNKYKYVFICTNYFYQLYNVRFTRLVYSRGCNLMTKIKALNFLYKDWLNYKKYYKKIGYPMNETFIEWLNREIELEGVSK